MMETKFTFRCFDKRIPIFLNYGKLSGIKKQIRKLNPDKVLVVTDSNVSGLYQRDLAGALRGIETSFIHFPAGERRKNMRTLSELLEESVPLTTRDSCIVALGGGVVGNMTGLLASMLYRSVRFVHVPTTLVAQLDSAISIKQAVNSSRGKNTFGSYHPPEFVYIDTSFLDTLGPRQIRNGVAEAIKHSVSQSERFFDYLYGILTPKMDLTRDQLHKIISETIKLRLKCLNKDPVEKRPPFEIGHTVGHSVERLLDGGWTHGESIGLGIRIESHFSHSLGYLSSTDLEKIYRILDRAGLPKKIPRKLSARQIVDNIRKYDNKKWRKGPMFVLPTRIGKVKVVIGAPLKVLERSLREFR